MITPKKLKKGDTIGLLSASGPILKERLEPGIKFVESLGFKVVIGKSCYEKYGYLAGSDDTRANDINEMFANPEINGIFCMKGGYGTPRIIDLLNYEIIEKNPKTFIGYSDVTALHVVLNQKCNMVTYHSPMPTTEFYKGVDEYTLKSFLENIMESESIRELKNPECNEIKILMPGVVQGQLIGGNLSLIAGLIGTPYEVDTKGKILFLEEIEEEPYRVDRMLMQLKHSGKLNDLEGIILGEFTDCHPEEPEKSLTLEQVIEDILLPLKKPLIYNVKCGHCLPTMTLPLGKKIRLDATNKKIYIID